MGKPILAPGEIVMPGQWLPAGPPERLLPPGDEPDVPVDDLLGGAERFARAYYRLSGRCLGVFVGVEAAQAADPYRHVRQHLPGGRLPWERR